MLKMPMQLNGKEIKQKMLKYIEDKGPELPVHIAKHMSMSTLFTSAFLSEMASEGMIKISDMKVGGSPLYFTQNKISLLENFTRFLNEKEREALLLLKENQMLKDEEQHPAIRVALRGLKDFAVPLNLENGRIIWKYFLAKEQKETKTEKPAEAAGEKKIGKPEIKSEEAKIQAKESITELEKLNKEIEEKTKELELLKQKLAPQKPEILAKSKTEIKKPEKIKAKAKKKMKPGEKEKFLNEIKEALAKKGFDILSIESFDKKQVFAKVAISGAECLIAAYDKKKIADSDLIKAYKKSLALNLPYHIISRGEVSKKTREAIDAYKKLMQMDILEKQDKKIKEALAHENPPE